MSHGPQVGRVRQITLSPLTSSVLRSVELNQSQFANRVGLSLTPGRLHVLFPPPAAPCLTLSPGQLESALHSKVEIVLSLGPQRPGQLSLPDSLGFEPSHFRSLLHQTGSALGEAWSLVHTFLPQPTARSLSFYSIYAANE